MSITAMEVLRLLFGTIWSIFFSFNIPGTQVTPGMFALFLLSAVVAIRFLRRIFGVDDD